MQKSVMRESASMGVLPEAASSPLGDTPVDKIAYRVVNWDEYFENANSRKIRRCAWVVAPNKEHGDGMLALLSLKDGPSIYGIWNLIIRACSQHENRQGWLTRDGTEAGTPWTAAGLALRWRRTEAEITRALQVLTSSQVGWMLGDSPSAMGCHPIEVGDCPGSLAQKGREGNRIEGKGNTTCAEVKLPTSTPMRVMVDCEMIYSLYPRKVGKQAALKAIKAATGRAAICDLEQATRLFADCQAGRPDVEHIPHPATWFNRDGWNDCDGDPDAQLAEWSSWKPPHQRPRPVIPPTDAEVAWAKGVLNGKGSA